MHADVVEQGARLTVFVYAIDVAQVIKVRPMHISHDFRWLHLILIRCLTKVRVHGQRCQPAPARNALGHTRRTGVAERQLVVVQRISVGVGGMQANQQAAVLGRLPARVAAVGGIHVVLKQFAIADMNGLRHHIRVGILRHTGVDQARMVLRVDVLLNRPARTANRNRVLGHAKAFDEVFLGHQRGFAAHLQVVVGAGTGARGVNHGIAEPQHLGGQRIATRTPLTVPNAHATLEVKQQTAVPQIGAGGIVGVGAVSQRGKAVNKAVEGAHLPAHHKVHFAAIGQGGGRHVRRAAAIRRQIGITTLGGHVEKLHLRLDGAIAAVAHNSFTLVYREAAFLVIHQRLDAQLGGHGADKGILLRAGEDRPRFGVSSERHVVQLTKAAVVQFEAVFAKGQALDQHFQPTVTFDQSGGLDFGVVEPQLKVIHFSINNVQITLNGDQHIVAGNLVQRAGEHAQRQVGAHRVVGIGAATETPGQGKSQQTE